MATEEFLTDYLVAWGRLIERTETNLLRPNGPLYFVGGVIDSNRLSGTHQPEPAVFWVYGGSQTLSRSKSNRGADVSGVGKLFAEPRKDRYIACIERQFWDAIVCVRSGGDIRYAYKSALSAGPILSSLDDLFINFAPHSALTPLALYDVSPPPESWGDFLLFPRRYFTDYGVSQPALTEYA